MTQGNTGPAQQSAIAPRGRRPRPFLARAYGVKRSFTWLTPAAFAAAEERLRNLPNFFARYTPEQIERIRRCEYDGPWLLGSGASLRNDLRAK